MARSREYVDSGAAINAGLDPEDHRIVALVAHFEAHGIKLLHERGGWWRVTEPANLDYDVIVSPRSDGHVRPIRRPG